MKNTIFFINGKDADALHTHGIRMVLKKKNRVVFDRNIALEKYSKIKHCVYLIKEANNFSNLGDIHRNCVLPSNFTAKMFYTSIKKYIMTCLPCL